MRHRFFSRLPRPPGPGKPVSFRSLPSTPLQVSFATATSQRRTVFLTTSIKLAQLQPPHLSPLHPEPTPPPDINQQIPFHPDWKMDESAATEGLSSGPPLPSAPEPEARPTSPSLAATHPDAPSTASGSTPLNPLPGVSTFAPGTGTPQIQQPRPVAIAPAMPPRTSPASTHPGPGGNLVRSDSHFVCSSTPPMWHRRSRQSITEARL